MQDEFDSLTEGLDIQIIGLNANGKTTKDSFTSERDLPWLQDTTEASVWKEWGIRYRDVLILDENNEPKVVFNLTETNLSDNQHYDTVKTAFQDLADVLCWNSHWT